METKEYLKAMLVEKNAWTPNKDLYSMESPEIQKTTRTALSRGKRPLPADWHIPAEFPYTHTHIDELDDWPQRLLHVESMTSHEWKPGHVYGGHREPAYRAVSYTWGRWVLRGEGAASEEHPALDIRGVPWEIPRVDPAHFSTTALTEILRQVCDIQPAVEFVWLDIACIDQRRGLAASREVGRQAGIFARAETVAVWLARTGRDDAGVPRLSWRLGLLQKAAYLLRTTRANWLAMGDEAAPNPTPLRFDLVEQAQMLEGVREMLCDPWFSGLWTLQESFLAAEKSIFFLGVRSCSPFRVQQMSTLSSSAFASASSPASNPTTSDPPANYSLADFADSCRSVLRYSLNKKWFATYDGVENFIQELSGLTQSSGLSGMHADANPLSLLGYTRYRYAKRDEDNVYGIVQIFGYRLGCMRRDAQPDEFYARSELELELGATLLADRQAQSQLFVFLETPEQGQGWRITRHSHVHHDLKPLWSYPRAPQDDDRVYCRLSTHQVGQITYGRFDGRVAVFAELDGVWATVEDGALSACTSDRSLVSWTGFRRFFPDMSPLFADSSEYRSPMYIQRSSRERHRAFGTYLVRKFGTSSHFVTLYLGCYPGETHVGMLLLYVNVGGVRYWHRLGLWMWCLGNLAACNVECSDVLDGAGSVWHSASGIYG